MNIRDRDDWIELAAKTLPKLQEYANSHGCGFNLILAQACLDVGDMRGLHNQFEKLWAELPDSPDIRHAPFFDLCDLCSESWALEDGR